MYLPAFIDQLAMFSEETFGPGERSEAVLDHITKELKEIEKDPADLTEWIDVILLAFDGASRQGYTSHQIARALNSKLEKNKQRTWPDWRTSDPTKAIEHIRGSHD